MFTEWPELEEGAVRAQALHMAAHPKTLGTFYAEWKSTSISIHLCLMKGKGDILRHL